MTRLSIEQLARLSRLLDEVVDADAAGRQHWLHALPAEHRDLEPALRRALLPPEGRDAHDRVLPTLPPIDASAMGLDSGLRSGDPVGPYQLTRRLGVGGMAEVWLAQRADGAFRREVALKTPSALQWRPDLADRFAIERDILAALEHPHIAHFYDAGVALGGRPYFALEYVAGRHLLAWANERQLGLRGRVELFLQVLQAVQYAHDQGVLHRDLKPTNVLVTEEGQVKLLDFGVARLMERPADADITQTHGRALTPGYASPEQRRGEAVDRASDVYSLGVMLHELLSGQPPPRRSFKTITPDPDVRPPSAQVDATAATLRGAGVGAIRRALVGDLDAITLKALAPASSDRYASAQAFALDLRRHLAGTPVDAMPSSWRYRTRKLLLRHRLAAAQAAVLTAVVLGLGSYALLQPDADSGTAVSAAAPAATPPASAPLMMAAADKSIAVLPFADMSEKRDQEHLADGLSQELIDRLAHSPHLRVIARTSAFAFKGKNEGVRAIAGQLGVAHVLLGSVRKSGDTLRITAQLVRAADDKQLWSQTFDRDAADIFKIQDDIAGAVAGALEAVLSDRTSPHAAKVPQVAAYHLVLQGDVYTNGPFQRDAERAEVAFKQAIAIDPGYALPWVKLALLYMRQAYFAWMPKDEAHARAREAIEAALRIEPNSMAAQAARFRYLSRVEFAWADARAVLDRMRAIDARDAALLPECEARVASISGRLDEAIQIQRQIVQRDPLNAAAIGTLAFYLLHADRVEPALELLRQELQTNPHAIGNHALIGVGLVLLDRGEDALAVIARERHAGYRLWALALAHWTLGAHEASDVALGEMKRAPQTNAYYVAQLYAVRGKKALAFEWLNKACTERQSGCEHIKIDRFLRPLRDDARYRALLLKLKLGEPAAVTS